MNENIHDPAQRMTVPLDDICGEGHESIFDRCSWFYAFCRERLFADHTQSIAARFKQAEPMTHRRVLFEVGCGPGFYSLRFAQLFPEFEVIGLDPSTRLLGKARNKAEKLGLRNCRFVRARAQHLTHFPRAADFIISSRLFLILRNRRATLEAMHASLRPAGLLFVAEPLSPFRTAIPITVMRAFKPITHRQPVVDADTTCRVLTKADFTSMLYSLPWKRVEHWFDGSYQYALCEKAL